MENLKFINFKAISEHLTNESRTIRRTNISPKYVDAVQELNDYIQCWKDRHPREATKYKNRGTDPKR